VCSSDLVELIARYAPEIERRHGQSAHGSKVKVALRRLKDLYGEAEVAAFGPRKLLAIRASMVREGMKRSTINEYVLYITSLFRWGVSCELVAPEIWQKLQAVGGLRHGEAPDGDPVTRVQRVYVRRIRRHLPRPVRALISLQLLTAARSGELVGLRAIDIDTSGDVWTCSLAQHKTAHKGKNRTLYFGPRAKRIIKLFLTPDRSMDKPLFSPREAVAEHHAKASTHRRSDQKPSPRKTRRTLGDAYTPGSYRKAIERACKQADVPKWTPHQLRHSAATFLRREFGIEVASLILGHSDIDTTLLYAEANDRKAREVIAQVG